MSTLDPIPLAIRVEGESRPGEGSHVIARILSAGLRRTTTLEVAVQDGSPPLSARIVWRNMAAYFEGSAPLIGSLELKMNMSDVLAISVERHEPTGLRFLHRTRQYRVFPRSDESDDPLASMWLSTFLYSVRARTSDVWEWFKEWRYVRYGGTPPASSERRHVLHGQSRPVFGTAVIDLVRDCDLRVVVKLGNGKKFVASLQFRFPQASHLERVAPSVGMAVARQPYVHSALLDATPLSKQQHALVALPECVLLHNRAELISREIAKELVKVQPLAWASADGRVPLMDRQCFALQKRGRAT